MAALIGAFVPRVLTDDAFSLKVALLTLIPTASIFVAVLLGHRRARGLDFFSPLVLMPLMFVVIYGLSAGRLDELFGTDARDKAIDLILLSLVSFLCGVVSVVAVRDGPWARTNAQRQTRTTAREPRLYALIGCYLIGVLGMLGYWAKTGGIPILSADLETSRIEALSGSGVPFYLSMAVMPATWVRYAVVPALSRADWAIGAITVALLISTGWRNTAVAFLFVALAIRHYKQPLPTRRLLAAGAALVVVISVLGLYRVYSSGITHYETYQLIAGGDYLGALVSYIRTYPSSFVLNTGLVVNGVPDPLGFQHGRTIFWNFQLIVPGNDAEPYDFVLKDELRQGFTGGGLPPTIVGEMYLNFGVLGVTLGMAALGAVCAAIHRTFVSAARAQVPRAEAVVLSALGLYYLSVAVRGGLANVLFTLTWLVLVTIAVTRAGRYLGGPAAGSPLRSVLGGR